MLSNPSVKHAKDTLLAETHYCSVPLVARLGCDSGQVSINPERVPLCSQLDSLQNHSVDLRICVGLGKLSLLLSACPVLVLDEEPHECNEGRREHLVVVLFWERQPERVLLAFFEPKVYTLCAGRRKFFCVRGADHGSCSKDNVPRELDLVSSVAIGE